jgi:hypothetical protein
MGIEPCPKTAQVFESTHRPSSIWVHPGAEFCVWTKHITHFVYCFVLRVADYMSVSLYCCARVRMSHLLLRDLRDCACINEQAGMAMAKRVHARLWDLQGIKYRPETVFNYLVCRVRAHFPVQE